MALKGFNFIGFSEGSANSKSFRAFSPASDSYLPENFLYATDDEFEKALSLAGAAFDVYRAFPASKRAGFLRAIAEEIMAAGESLIERCTAESGLPVARITGERARTCGQLNLFASLLEDGWYVDARIDTAQPERTPLPKPDIRRMLVPTGPVAVYGSSNFPLAFSTAGGDTASALAAGCPVVVKAHSSHPGTNEIVSSAILRAAQKTGMPEGVFSSMYLSHDRAIDLAKHKNIKAVGFTGSRKVGMLLFQAGTQRDEPIPVYAEMSAINPVVITNGALQERSAQIASGLTDSITLGVGQFCTNPGLVLLQKGAAADNFIQQVSESMLKANPGTMLNQNICKSYATAVLGMQKEKGVRVIGKGARDPEAAKNEAAAFAFAVDAKDFIGNPKLAEEMFGPASMFVLYDNEDELTNILHAMEGQLTATVHAAKEPEALVAKIVDAVAMKAGRVIFGGFPTGVEVCHSMQHGGPFPSTTDGRSTSVGTGAIYRFLRPVAFQNFPDDLLPQPLQNNNPLNIDRLVDGVWTKNRIGS